MPAEEPVEFPIKLNKIEIPPLRDGEGDDQSSSSSHSDEKPKPPASEKNNALDSGFLKLGSDLVGWDFMEPARPSEINSATLETDVDNLISFILQPPGTEKNEDANDKEAEPEAEAEQEGDEDEDSSSSEEKEQEEEQDQSDSSIQQSSAAATVSSAPHATDSASERTDTKSGERDWDRSRPKRKRDDQPLSRSERRRLFIE